MYITVGLNEMAKKIENVSPKELELILIEMVGRTYSSSKRETNNTIDKSKTNFG